MCEILARAMKEWDRRANERQGYSNTAGDCLAFKYMRDVSTRAFMCCLNAWEWLCLQSQLQAVSAGDCLAFT